MQRDLATFDVPCGPLLRLQQLAPASTTPSPPRQRRAGGCAGGLPSHTQSDGKSEGLNALKDAYPARRPRSIVKKKTPAPPLPEGTSPGRRPPADPPGQDRPCPGPALPSTAPLLLPPAGRLLGPVPHRERGVGRVADTLGGCPRPSEPLPAAPPGGSPRPKGRSVTPNGGSARGKEGIGIPLCPGFWGVEGRGDPGRVADTFMPYRQHE